MLMVNVGPSDEAATGDTTGASSLATTGLGAGASVACAAEKERLRLELITSRISCIQGSGC
jgi:hypothetical protein